MDEVQDSGYAPDLNQWDILVRKDKFWKQNHHNRGDVKLFGTNFSC